MTFLSFLPALRAGFVAWDDDLNLTDNPAYRGLAPAHLRWMLTTTLGGHYQPLTWMTFAVDSLLWGVEPAGYHLTSVLLHVANAVAFYALAVAILRRAAGSAPAPALRVAAATGALFFALHPLRVESVAWVSERRDVLSGLFYLLALLAYVRAPGSPDPRRRRCLLASLACLVLSLLAKAWGMTFPVVLLILDAYPLGRLARGSRPAVLREKALFAVPALAAAIMAWRAQSGVEEMRTLAEHGVLARVAQAAYGLCFYLGKTLVPVALSPVYLLETGLDPTAPRYLLSMLAVGGITAGLVLVRRRWPWALAAWATYAVIVSPVLGLAQSGPQMVADRYSYLACLPWALLVAAAMLRAGRAPAPVRRAGAATAVAALGALAALTFRQAAVWKDSVTLWSRAIDLDPASCIAFTNRGWARREREPDAAIADYTEAIRLNPRFYLAYFDRGEARHRRGDLAGAIVDFSAAIALEPDDPKAYNNRGWARQALGDWAGAAEDYARALTLAAPTWRHRALVEGNLAAARAHLAAGGP